MAFFANQMYRDLKDRQQLIRYREKVERGSADERKINELLNNTVRHRSQCHHSLHHVNQLNFVSPVSANPMEELISSLRFLF